MIRVLMKSVVAFGAALLFTAATASAQTAELNGKVADQSGAVLPGVTVTVTNTATAATTIITRFHEPEDGFSKFPSTD